MSKTLVLQTWLLAHSKYSNLDTAREVNANATIEFDLLGKTRSLST